VDNQNKLLPFYFSSFSFTQGLTLILFFLLYAVCLKKKHLRVSSSFSVV